MKKLKKKEIFSLGLYKEGIRRARIPGIIFLVLLSVAAILMPLGTVIIRSGYKNSSAYSFTATEAHFSLFLTIFVIAPVLSWTLFSFLNKRNSSDFYHSLPHTRFCLFLSTAAAFVTWIAGIIIITSAVSRLTIALFPNHLSVVSGTYLTFMLGCFVASLLVGSVMILAMTITGTVLNNFLVAGLIMFLPRVTIAYIISAVTNKFPLMLSNYVSGIFSPDINILTGIFNIFSYYDGISLYKTVPQIYTVCLALVYLAIGGFLFCRRKSESAEIAAPSRLMQAVYRIVLTMVICIPICYNIFVGNIYSRASVFGIFCGYVFAVLVYLSYELITTRKWKNLIRVLPGLAIVALLNVALIGTMYGIYHIESSFTPDADEVEYISIISSDDRVYDFKGYATKAASDIKLTDKDTVKIVTDALKDNTKYLFFKGGYTSCIVKIKSGLTTKYRRIYLSEEAYGSLSTALSSSEEYAKIWMTLPVPQRKTLELPYVNCSTDELEDFYKLMKNEVSNLDFEKWYGYISYSWYMELGRINFTTNGSNIYIPFAPYILPETSKAYVDLVNNHSDYSADFVKELFTESEQYESSTVTVTEISLHHYLPSGRYYIQNIHPNTSGEFPKNSSVTLENIASECFDFDSTVDVNKDFFVISLSSPSLYHGTVSSRFIIAATEDAYHWLCENVIIE